MLFDKKTIVALALLIIVIITFVNACVKGGLV